jgi:hypothetical protein|nr:MAG TPA: hypothetical protein [Caudoviricetes sp.]
MNAEQMFEELGYEKREESEGVLLYISDFENSILFENKRVTITDLYLYGRITININCLLVNAIQKQCNELGWLEDEKQEKNQETNLGHYKDEIIELCADDLAISKGKVKSCSAILCSECDFADKSGQCIGNHEIINWLKQPYKKPTYKLSQFEYDLINAFDRCKECCLLNEIECLKKLTQKGYFSGIDPFTKVHDILANCEVI